MAGAAWPGLFRRICHIRSGLGRRGRDRRRRQQHARAETRSVRAACSATVTSSASRCSLVFFQLAFAHWNPTQALFGTTDIMWSDWLLIVGAVPVEIEKALLRRNHARR